MPEEKEEEYELKLLFRAFNWALIMHGEKELRKNPCLLILEMDYLRDMDLFISSAKKPFKDYEKMIKENPNFLEDLKFERPRLSIDNINYLLPLLDTKE